MMFLVFMKLLKRIPSDLSVSLPFSATMTISQHKEDNTHFRPRPLEKLKTDIFFAACHVRGGNLTSTCNVAEPKNMRQCFTKSNCRRKLWPLDTSIACVLEKSRKKKCGKWQKKYWTLTSAHWPHLEQDAGIYNGNEKSGISRFTTSSMSRNGDGWDARAGSRKVPLTGI